MKINVCLSTYNGEAFLSEQIKSILNQTYPDFTLLIRDDGSTDRTVELIKSYQAKDKRIEFINEEDIKNIGAPRSFYELVRYEQADFYFFSDQDDVWKADKISLFISEAQQQNNSKPITYYSNFTTVNEELRTIRQLAYPDKEQVTLEQNLVGNKIIGCSIMINNALARIWELYDFDIDSSYHDSYLVLMALSMGKLVFINNSTILYRQHSHNLIGDKKKASPLNSFWAMIYSSTVRAEDISVKYQKYIVPDRKEIISDFYKLSFYSFFKRLFLVERHRYNRGNFKENLMVKVLLISQFHNQNKALATNLKKFKEKK
ncbi:glycosyltransferase family 2 protein [Lactococcus fujiensis]|uniref:Alpha-L-Rha alpha-1,3-L-rhamnosyltransferase n=1 Tax=Lactococcus fujiensis JCM 16395 TaxID=1291764 RepID=A0A2A5RLG4_9LACT|nr:glycosyltransferase family 2 protein [Lactococcus fujiensis]PCS00103.1 alpha-L-Rha alpha-1,3-L-rhamnosyltransferase [Lactococcus fujiensis JCM 16395]